MLMIRFSLYLWFSFYFGCDGFFGVKMFKECCNWNYSEVPGNARSKTRLAFHSILVCRVERWKIWKRWNIQDQVFPLILPPGIRARKLFQHRIVSDQTCMITLCLTLPSCLITLNMLLAMQGIQEEKFWNLINARRCFNETKLHFEEFLARRRIPNTSRTPMACDFRWTVWKASIAVPKPHERSFHHGSQP